MMIKRPSLLAPAGSSRSMYTAIRFGADAVYCGMKQYSLRAKAENFEEEQFGKAVADAHRKGVKVFLTLNVFPMETDIPGMLEAARAAEELGADALIVSDIGLAARIRKELPGMAIHASTQANITNSETAKIWQSVGAERIILARETTIAQIAAIRDALGDEMDLEAFVHGSVCMAWSGRCMLSNYFTGRSANKGQCTQPCRWSYRFVETNREDQAFELEEDDRGSYVLSAQDLCMIDHLKELAEAGVSCFKIEGRTKSEYYVGTVTGAYRRAMDAVFGEELPRSFDFEANRKELYRFSHRPYHTGFFLNEPRVWEQDTHRELEREYVAYVLEERPGGALVEMKNRFYVGDELESVTPRGSSLLTVEDIVSPETGEHLDAVKVPASRVFIACGEPLEAGDMLRGKLRNRLTT